MDWAMTKSDIKALRSNLASSLRFVVSDRYVAGIVYSLLEEVVADMECFSSEDYGAEDVKSSVGRVLCRRLGVIEDESI